MSREILFRGKNVDNGAWVEGYLMDENCINVPFENNNVGDYLFYYINPITRGQYTGLRDRNGTKIFEGDILRAKNKIPYVISYSDDVAGFVAKGDVILLVSHMANAIKRSYEIIGNIYDNPELLGGDSNK